MANEIQITPFQEEFLEEATALFIAKYRKQRQAIPLLPERMEDPQIVISLLKELSQSTPGIAALQNGRLVGYMSWFLIDHFRGTSRKGAYCPEWGHAAREEAAASIYRRMYGEAARQWLSAGCGVYAITLLAGDQPAERFWFWNGFGMIVVDAIRSIQPLNVTSPESLVIRRAQLEDAESIAVLEAEHYKHYSAPPISMAPQSPEDAEAYRKFLSRPENQVWLACDGKEPVGYIRFEPEAFGAADIVHSESTIAISAAYTRPEYRGHRAAPAMVEAGLRYYAAKGYERCSVDFESTNPEASHFWMKYFEPVCISVMRLHEAQDTN
jgi:ribosomal protein S18 acetylase RimI-like enzyme